MATPVLLLAALTACTAMPQASDSAMTPLVVMSFNTWGAGANQGKSIDDTLRVLRRIDADIIGLQEVRAEDEGCVAEYCPASGTSRAKAIAMALGYFVYEQKQQNEALWANAILSRYPILGATPNTLGVTIGVDDRTVYAFNVHLNDYPYQPYQLMGIAYGESAFLRTEAEAVDAATHARGGAVSLLLSELRLAREADAVVIFGDFNEPSHRDWTSRAVAAGRHPVAVRYPATRRLESAGYVDAFRAVYPDEIAKPGFTYTPSADAADPDEHHDRIDFVFAKGRRLKVLNAAVVGEKTAHADIVVQPWPSDHRAVVATVTF